MDALHSTHIGISSMKNLARYYLWWPKIDHDIEMKVKGYSICPVLGRDPPPTVLHLWECPNKPWSRGHVDYAGPFLGKMLILLVKWIEVHITNSSTTAVTIEKLTLTFVSLGLPKMLITDNGPSFANSEFTESFYES